VVAKPYDVCLVSKYDLRLAKHNRTSIVVAIVGADLRVYPTTGRLELCDNLPSAFLINSDDLDFPATKLRYTSYVLDRPSLVPQDRVLKILGKLEGDLKRRFIKHFGLEES